MSGIEIALLIVCILIGIAIYSVLFGLYIAVGKFLDRTVGIFSLAPEKLVDHLANALPSPVRIGIMVVLFIVSVIYITVSFISLGSAQACFDAMLDGTTIGSFLSLAEAGFSPTETVGFPAMVGAAVSSFISTLYARFTMKTAEDSGWPCHWLLGAVFGILFAFMSYLFAFHLADWYVSASELLVQLFDTMSAYWSGSHDPTIGSILATIGTGLGLLAMLIAALITFIIVVREYLETIFYGLFSLFISVILMLIVQEWLHWPDAVNAVLFLIALFSPEFIRAHDGAKEFFESIITEICDFSF